MKSFTTLVTLLILTVVFITGCGISKDKYDVAVMEASELREQLSEVQADLTTARDNLDKSNSDLATAQQNMNMVIDDRDSILKQLDQTETDLTTAQDQLESAESQITTLQSQNDFLQEIVNLTQYSTKADAVIIPQAPNVNENVVSFIADYAGYVVVSGTSSTINTYIRVEDSFPGYPYREYRHYFSTGTTLKIPVLPGTISVYLMNNDPVGATATITVIYYY